MAMALDEAKVFVLFGTSVQAPEETSMSMTLESSVTVMVLTSITGYRWTFVASMLRTRSRRRKSLFQH